MVNVVTSSLTRTSTLVLGADTLSVAQVARFARDPQGIGLEMDPAALGRVDRSVEVRNHLIERGDAIYGVTTGFGDSCNRKVSADRVEALQRNLLRFLMVGSGPNAPVPVVRATMLIRANCLARGYSAIRGEVIQLLMECLAADILPVIPVRGSVGASGDLAPLSYVAAMLIGEGEVLVDGGIEPARLALPSRGLRPVTLAAKEGLALVNGTSFMSAYAALAVDAARNLAATADVCTALASEAMKGNSDHYCEFLHDQKAHPGQVRSAGRIRDLLVGSQLSRDRTATPIEPLIPHAPFQELDDGVQDRYSLRCAPHVVGVLYDSLDWMTAWTQVEINSSNDNPLFDPLSGTAHSGGNFYGGHIGQAMDALKVAVASVGDLLDRQLALIVDEKFNKGLTPNLIPFTGLDGEGGTHHGFKGMQIASSALAAEALKLSAPATVFSRSTESHNQDKVSMGTIAARDAAAVVELVEEIAAIHLLAVCQAADLRGPDLLSPATRTAYRLVRERVPVLIDDRPMDRDLADVASLVRRGSLNLPG